MTAAKDFSAILANSALEGPSSAEALVVGAQVAELMALGASLSDLDPDAAAGIRFLLGRIRTSFIIPALATASRDALLALWVEVAPPVLRLMDAVAVCLYEAGRATNSEVIFRRLEHADRSAVVDVAGVFEQHVGGAAADELRRSLALIEAARARFRDLLGEHAELELLWVKGFHQGVLIWALGSHLCAQIADLQSSLAGVSPVRAGLAIDALEFVSEGAQLAGSLVAQLAGLGFADVELLEALRESSRKTELSQFLLDLTVKIPRVFGPDVRYSLGLFCYPDEPDVSELHLVIDTSAAPERACDLLDELCDNWWDAAIAPLDVDIFPVLGVIARE